MRITHYKPAARGMPTCSTFEQEHALATKTRENEHGGYTSRRRGAAPWPKTTTDVRIIDCRVCRDWVLKHLCEANGVA